MTCNNIISATALIKNTSHRHLRNSISRETRRLTSISVSTYRSFSSTSSTSYYSLNSSEKQVPLNQKYLKDNIINKRVATSKKSPDESPNPTPSTVLERTDSQSKEDDNNYFSNIDLKDISTIPPEIRKNIVEKYSFTKATKVQKEVLSRIPLKNDIKVQASTGSGKTLAYLIPSLEIMLRTLSPEETSKGKQVSVLILAPTRELVLQISDEAKKLMKGFPFKTLPFIGGTSKKEDLNRILSKRVDLVVATPGRIVDILSSSAIFRSQLESLKVLVLDEADELIKHGFAENVSTVLKNLPSSRLTMLFSATMPKTLEETIARKALKDIENTHSINTVPAYEKEDLKIRQQKIDQKIIAVSHNLQIHLVYGILKGYSNSKSILFLPTVISVQIVANIIKDMGLTVFEMHSLLDQKSRVSVASDFRAASQGVLITTDVSARGMDYPDVSLVLQWGVPSSPDIYLHRIGRTGRAGRSGKAILVMTLLEERFYDLLKRKGVNYTLLDIDNEVTKPPPEEIHSLNKLCSAIKPGLIKQYYRSNLTYYYTMRNNLGLSIRQVNSQVKNLITGLGLPVPVFSQSNLPVELQRQLEEVDKAKSLLVKRRSGN